MTRTRITIDLDGYWRENSSPFEQFEISLNHLCYAMEHSNLDVSLLKYFNTYDILIVLSSPLVQGERIFDYEYYVALMLHLENLQKQKVYIIDKIYCHVYSIWSWKKVLSAIESDSIDFIFTRSTIDPRRTIPYDCVNRLEAGQQQEDGFSNGLSYDEILAEVIRERMNRIFPQMRLHIKDVLEGRRDRYSVIDPKTVIIELLDFLERALPIAKAKRTNDTPTAVEKVLSNAYSKMQAVLCCERLVHENSRDSNVVPGFFLPESLVRVLLEKPLFSWQTRKIIESLRRKALQLQSGGRNWTTEDLRQCVADGFTWWGRNRKVRALEILENLDLLQPIDASFPQHLLGPSKEDIRYHIFSSPPSKFPFSESENRSPNYRRQFIDCAAQTSIENEQRDFDIDLEDDVERVDPPKIARALDRNQSFCSYSPISAGSALRSPQSNVGSTPVAPIADPNPLLEGAELHL